VRLEAVKAESKVEDETLFGGPAEETAGLSAYERIRLENIRQREELFARLEFGEAKAGLGPRTPGPGPRTPGPGPRTPGRAPAARRLLRSPSKVARRVSSRLAEGKVVGIDRFNPEAATAGVSRRGVKAELKARSGRPAGAKASHVRRPQPALRVPGLAEVPGRRLALEEFGFPECSGLMAALGSPAAAGAGTSAAAWPALTITPGQVAKLVPERIFSVAVHPGPRLVAAAGDKRGHLGLWACEDREGSTHLLRYHSRPVNCLSWDLAQPTLLLSTSYDGTVRQLDADQQVSSLLYHDPAFLAAGGWCSSHAQADPHTLVVSQQGGVVVVDRRAGALPVASHRLLERHLVKSISCHPGRPHLLLAGANNGTCYIYDLRWPAAQGALLPPVSELLGAARSLSSAQFSPDGRQAATLSFDNNLRLYNTETTLAAISPSAQVHHNNQTGRWLTPLRASWHPGRAGLLATGSMEQPRQVELWATEGGRLALAARLRGEELSSVASVLAIHPTRDAVLGGNASGRLHLFM